MKRVGVARLGLGPGLSEALATHRLVAVLGSHQHLLALSHPRVPVGEWTRGPIPAEHTESPQFRDVICQR
jgi:hypothetical protein